MNNCIGTYGRVLGLDVLAAVIDQRGVLRLNIQIHAEGGVQQLLGKHNRDAVDELGDDAQGVVDALSAPGVEFDQRPLGCAGLRLPQGAFV